MPAEPTTAREGERAILVGVECRSPRGDGRHPPSEARHAADPALAMATLSLEDSLEELALLAQTAGATVLNVTTQRLNEPNPATLIGKGKVEELKDLVLSEQPDLVIFDDDLSPSQQRNLEKALNVKIVDRTALILDIFAQRARTREAQLQVELAQLQYLLPRLSELWVQFSRLAGAAAGGGGGGRIATRGPGETQLEVDRRAIRRRIADLKERIEALRTTRELHRQRRRDESLPVVALVGYTNAGKSTLLHALSGADVLVEDKLFATLDPTTRRVALPNGQQVLVTDTVGFIQRLPTALVVAFRATLEEINDADVLVHVVDITHPNYREQIQAVGKTLDDLQIDEKPIITALNKIDRLAELGLSLPDQALFPHAVPMAAARGEGLDAFLSELQRMLAEDQVQLRVRIPYQNGKLVQLFHQRGMIATESYDPEGTAITGTLPRRYLADFEPFAY